MSLTWPAWIRAIARQKWRLAAIATCVALAGIIVLGVAERRTWSWGDFPGWVAAAATIGLLIGAGATVHFARKAFEAQSEQLRDQRALTRQQGDRLKVQSDQLDLQSRQFEEQRKVNAAQTEVFSLQARELEASLAERKEAAERQRRAQANQVTAWFGRGDGSSLSAAARPMAAWGAIIRNDSDLPIVNTRVFFHFVAADSPASLNWNPIMRGGPPERIRVIPPHSDRFVEIPSSIRTMIDQCDDSVYVVSIEFGDAAGNYWERDPRGGLFPRETASS